MLTTSGDSGGSHSLQGSRSPHPLVPSCIQLLAMQGLGLLRLLPPPG